MSEHAFAVELVPIDALDPDPRNVNEGDVGAIATAIAVDGWHGSVVCRKKRGWPQIVAGEHRWRALQLLQSDGIELGGEHRTYDDLLATKGLLLPPKGTVPAQVLTLDELRAMRKMIADNRASALSTTDEAGLATLLTELAEADALLGSLFDGDDIDDILRQLELEADPEKKQATDHAPPRPDDAITQRGDLWVLGDHRLLCGDATEPADYERLLGGEQADMVWTDPPYGVAYGEKNRFLQTVGKSDRLEEDIAGDEADPEALRRLLSPAFKATLASTRPGAVWFVAAPPGPPLGVFTAELLALNVWRQLLAWVKNQPVFGRSDYHYQHETLFYGWTPGAAHRPPADHALTSVWAFDRPRESKLHPTMKPVALVLQAVMSHSVAGEVVLDPFGGSGTTLVACEQEGRRARLIEIDPGYCDVIVTRWEEMTGEKATREHVEV